MQKDQVDQSLSFKKRARRRLVGAIALVLMMVVILPMMLEDREKPIQEDIEIIMSPPSSDLESSDAIDADGLSDIEEASVQDSADTASSVTEALEMPEVVTQTVTPEPSREAKEEVTKPIQAVEEVATRSAGESTGYYVQIGVFSNPDNIDKLQRKLTDLGYRSLTEKISTDTGIKTRLRTESFDDRNEAAIALQNIKDAGLAGMVVSQK